MNDTRVVVTGLGVVSSIGIGWKKFWNAALKGKSGISRITTFDTAGFKCHKGGEVKNFKAEKFIPARKAKFLGRASQLAIAASVLALNDSKLPKKSLLIKNRMGVLVGTTMGEKPLEELIFSWVKHGLRDIDRRRIMQSAANNISNNIAIHNKILGPNYLFPTACAAGNYAIGYGYDLIKNGELDYAIAGGADAFFYVTYLGFQSLYAMAPDKCRPFDKNRKGMMVGEGSGMLILERLDSALKRKARIYAEILGYGLSCDAYDATAPEVKGITKAMENALREAGISSQEVDYICAHGTGTPLNDKIECRAIKNVLKDRYKEVPITSLKSMLGHCMGAASALEAVSCCLTVKNDVIPPTINFCNPDPECDIDCVPNEPKRKEVRIALNNGFAFGGNNSCLVIKKFYS
jgi:3-oxoacyl-[acyl-carrier-protein] synthase II